MKHCNSDSRYFNFPLVLLQDFLDGDNHIECFDNILKYAIFEHTKKYGQQLSIEQQMEKAEIYFNIKINVPVKNYYYECKKVFYQFYGEPQPMAGINKDVLLDFYKNDKKEWDKFQLLGFLATKSIVGNAPYKKATKLYVLSRMAGKSKAVKDVNELLLVFQDLNKEYRFKKLMNLLADNWGMKYYSKKMRGFYISY